MLFSMLPPLLELLLSYSLLYNLWFYVSDFYNEAVLKYNHNYETTQLSFLFQLVSFMVACTVCNVISFLCNRFVEVRKWTWWLSNLWYICEEGDKLLEHVLAVAAALLCGESSDREFECFSNMAKLLLSLQTQFDFRNIMMLLDTTCWRATLLRIFTNFVSYDFYL